MEHCHATSRCVESPAAAQLPELCFGKLGPKRSRRTAHQGWPHLEELRKVILAGDIGGTNARLALYEVRDGKLEQVIETVFPSRQHSGLDEIVAKFADQLTMQELQRPRAACFGIAGPVVNGRSETSNLPWVVESTQLAAVLGLPLLGRQAASRLRLRRRPLRLRAA